MIYLSLIKIELVLLNMFKSLFLILVKISGRYVYKRMYVFRFYDLSYYLNNCKFGDVSIYNNLDIRFVLKIISFKVISLFI